MIDEKFRWDVTIVTYQGDISNKNTLSFGFMGSDVYSVMRRINDMLFNGIIMEIRIARA